MSDRRFEGTTDQQQLAAQVYQIMTTQGALFAADAPIQQTLTNLADFFARQRHEDPARVAGEIDAALRENAPLFSREERDNQFVYTTSRRGTYQPRVEDTSHMLRQRLYEPE